MGDRPAELRVAVRSVLAQRGAPIDVLVLGNGCAVPPVPAGVRTVALPANLGIPGGRNAGVDATTGDVVLFLDDDGCYPDPSLADRVRQAFADEPRLGVLCFRIVDPQSGRTERRHVPRLRAADPMRAGEVTTFLGGACAIRRAMLAQVGPLPAGFFYGHEETDLAWRALDAGWRIRYDPAAVMHHPATAPTRHAQFFRTNARNRVWLARRNLPWPLVPLYLATWVVLTLLRTRDATGLRAWAAGFVEGWRSDPGPRRPMRWRTVAVMTRLGRPPVV